MFINSVSSDFIDKNYNEEVVDYIAPPASFCVKSPVVLIDIHFLRKMKLIQNISLWSSTKWNNSPRVLLQTKRLEYAPSF